MQFIKQDMFKRKVNPDIFKFERINPKSGKKRIEWKSTADLDTKQMTDAIDRFKNWSLKNTGIRLPEANEQQFLDHIQNEIDQNKQWL
jgi:predicted transcriptional regulator